MSTVYIMHTPCRVCVGPLFENRHSCQWDYSQYIHVCSHTQEVNVHTHTHTESCTCAPTVTHTYSVMQSHTHSHTHTHTHTHTQPKRWQSSPLDHLRGHQERHEVPSAQLAKGDEPATGKHGAQHDAIEKDVGHSLEGTDPDAKFDVEVAGQLQLLLVQPEPK